MSETRKVIYSGIFLTPESREHLLKAIPAMHPQVHAGHVTLVFRPTAKHLEALEAHIGKVVGVRVVAAASDERGQAVRVVPPAALVVASERVVDRRALHVTISCAAGISPVYSNELLARVEGEPVALDLEGEVRHFYGK